MWARLDERIRAVLRLEWPVFREIAADPHAFPQALAVVVGASALAGLGHSGFSRLALLGVAVNIVRWVIATGLIWVAATFTRDEDADYARLLRCTGFADAWFAVNLGNILPWIGWLFPLVSIGLWMVALVEATREALGADTAHAALICAIAALLSLLPLLVVV